MLGDKGDRLSTSFDLVGNIGMVTMGFGSCSTLRRRRLGSEVQQILSGFPVRPLGLYVQKDDLL